MKHVDTFETVLLLLLLIVFPAASTEGAFRRLAFVEAQFDGLGAVTGLGGPVTVSPDGSHVYAAFGDALSVLIRDPTTGALTFVEVKRNGIDGVEGLGGVSAVTVSPDGEHVYVTSSDDNAVAVFGRDAMTGALAFVEVQRDGAGGVDGLFLPTAIAVSPDGGDVYVTGAGDNAVATFSRNPTTGALTFVEVQRNNVGGVDGLSNPSSVAVSPDGKHVYVGGYNDNAVAVFKRDTQTGALTFVEVQRDGAAGVEGLIGVISIGMSPDGGHVYVAGADDNALVTFRRSATTGKLTFVAVQRNGIGGVEGLVAPSRVTVSPDGTLVYVTSPQESTLAVFTRNVVTGILTFEEVEREGAGGIWGIDFANAITLTHDGRHVYVSGDAVSLAAFRTIICGNGLLDPNEQCDDGNVTDGDGCDSNCTPTSCGNGIVTAGEQCDDGNVVDGDGCRPDCLGQPHPGLLNWLRGGRAAPAISADGRFVAFESDAPDLVSGDTNGTADVFIVDRKTGMIERVSIDSAGAEANGPSYGPAISADGQFVAFSSNATNLVTNDTNDADDVFVHDRQTGTTERVSVDSSGGQGNGPSGLHRVAISAAGRFVAFESGASNLAPGDIHGTGGVLVHDRETGTTERVGLNISGEEVGTDEPTISADGRYVAFRGDVLCPGCVLVPDDTNGFADIFVRDRLTGTVERVSVSSSGEQANEQSGEPAISADGRYVVFTSLASNLVSDDSNRAPDVFIHDREAGTTERMSVSSDAAEADFGGYASSVSADGRYVAFNSGANNLVPGDFNGGGDFFLRDRVKATTERVSVDSAGLQARGDSSGGFAPAVSTDGRFVAFISEAGLVPSDTNGAQDIYVRDRGVTKDAAPGDTVTTDWAGDGATVLSPLEVAVTTPNAGTVSIAEATASVPFGFSVVGVQAQITAPPATETAPLVLVFTIDASAVPSGQDESGIELFKNAVLVPPCTGAPAMASPDPCVSSRTLLPGGNIEITVLTSSLSVWASGNTTICGDGVLTIGEQCDGTADAACPGRCRGDCTCPPRGCGDNVRDPSEECDGIDAPTCPGRCQVDCTCRCTNTVTDPHATVKMVTRNGAGKLSAKMMIELPSYLNEPVSVRLDDTDTVPIARLDVGALPPHGSSGKLWQLKLEGDGLQNISLKSLAPSRPGKFRLKAKARRWFTAGADQPAISTSLTATVGEQCFTHVATKKTD